MAANSKGRALAGSFGKRLASLILAGRSRDPAALPRYLTSASRRAAHSSSYERDIDDQVVPTVVPDHVIQSGTDVGKYWGPHPQTGVFGPAAEQNGGAAGGRGACSPPPPGNGTSVLEQTVWFRPLEDVDKPPYP